MGLCWHAYRVAARETGAEDEAISLEVLSSWDPRAFLGGSNSFSDGAWRQDATSCAPAERSESHETDCTRRAVLQGLPPDAPGHSRALAAEGVVNVDSEPVRPAALSEDWTSTLRRGPGAHPAAPHPATESSAEFGGFGFSLKSWPHHTPPDWQTD